MLRERAAFDPTGLCNPGKIIPVLKGCGEARAVAGVKGPATVSRNHPAAAVSQRLSAPPPPTSGGVFDAARACDLLAGIVGDEHVSSGGGATGTGGGAAFDDTGAAVFVAPATSREACEVLKVAAREGWKVVPAGAGTWLDAGNPPRGGRVVVKTARMARVVAHEPADLLATAEAGVTLADFNREAGRAGQWLPLDPPGGARATLGGVAATGTGGAQSLGYGTPRAYVLGLRAALADGRVVTAGGRVVKNVAGYDLCKLFVGSYGTLGLIMELTLKLRPRPAREATLAATSTDLPRLAEAARALVASQLFPVAVEIVSPRMADALSLPSGGGFALLARFAGTEGAVA